MNESRYITSELEAEIIDVIDRLAARNDKITWKMIAGITGFTRAALSRNKRIQQAYKSAKLDTNIIVSDSEKIKELSEKLVFSNNQIEKDRILREKMDQRYIRNLYNAIGAGLTEEELNKPMSENMKTAIRSKGR